VHICPGCGSSRILRPALYAGSDLRKSRGPASVNGHDAAAVTYGNEAAKRTLLVAAAEKHSLLFVDRDASGNRSQSVTGSTAPFPRR
jgi:hypothetical protein